MRIDSYKITPEQPTAHSRPNRFTALLIRLYAFTLRLYPASFRATFAEEMRDVFAMSIREAQFVSVWALLGVLWREVIHLPANILHARFRRLKPVQGSTIWRARQVTRLSSLIISLLILQHLVISLSSPDTLALDGVRLSMFFVLLFLTAVSMLLAWRWERLGGLMTMVCGTALGAFLTFYLAYFRPVEISVVGLALIGILWSLPFVTFGFMFYHLSQRSLAVAHAA